MVASQVDFILKLDFYVFQKPPNRQYKTRYKAQNAQKRVPINADKDNQNGRNNFAKYLHGL
jgi:hypothetical protein